MSETTQPQVARQAIAIDLPAPAPPPRPLTAKAKLRAWAEPRVRFWWLAGIVLLLIELSWSTHQTWKWLRDNALIRSGVVVQARIDEADGLTISGRPSPPDSQVKLSYDFKGQSHAVKGILAGRREAIHVGDLIDIRVDPNQPEQWTYRSQPTSLFREIIGGIVLLPAVIFVIVTSLLLRRRLLRLWQQGESRQAIVMDSRHTALAPMSRLVHCTLQDGPRGPLLTVFIPRRLADLKRGDLLWLIVWPKRPNKAIAAMGYG